MAQQKKKNILSGDKMFQPLEKKRYSEQIAELIQDKILEEHLEIDTNLPSEKDLAREFQVSRSVVREALRILESSGLVEVKKGPTGGIFVSHVYHKPLKKSLSYLMTSGRVTIDHLFDVRLLIEPYIAKEATQHATAEDIENLEGLVRDSEGRRDDVKALKRNNLDFHILLAKASGNPVLSMLLESLFEILEELTFDFLDLSLEQHFTQIHRGILEVMVQKRPDDVTRLIIEDILDVKENVKNFKKPNRH